MNFRSVLTAALPALVFVAPAHVARAQVASPSAADADHAAPFDLSAAADRSSPARDGGASDPAHPPHGPGHAHDFTLPPPPLGADLSRGWLDPWPHTHYSRRGTPFVHLFANEPAFMDRDFFLDFGFASGEEGEEFEAEAELEYTFTRRIGIVIEGPYIHVNPDEGPTESGFGDVAVSPRFLLLDYDRFLLSANLEFAFPTGDEDRGLGAGEGVVAPSVSTWIDLGRNFALHNNVGIEHGLRSDSDVLAWGGALTYSVYLKGNPQVVREDGSVRAHFPEGMLNLIGEIRGEHPLDGDDEGSGTAAWILGASYSITPHVEVRGALTFPAWNPREFDNGVIVGFVYHF